MQFLKTLLWILWIILASHAHSLIGQNVGIGTLAPDESAMLDISATDKGMLVPRLSSAQRTAISSPANGLLVFDTDTGSFWFYQGSAWKNLDAFPDRLTDADGNTRVMVEKNPNEDIIRFDLAGNEKMRLTQKTNRTPRLEILSDRENTYIGEGAGLNNDGGFFNTSIGKNTLMQNNSSYNTAVGFGALKNNTTGNSNTALGSFALENNSMGYSNSAIGNRALQNNTTGLNNTAMGYGALQNNTAGYVNTAMGYGALQNNTIGFRNTAVGNEALEHNTSGYVNTAMGDRALKYNTTGYSNTAAGFEALQDNTIGFANTSMGIRTLLKNTTGYRNTALGYEALQYNIDGYNNTALGFNALVGNISGTGNLGLGFGADVIGSNYINASAIGYYSFVGCSNCMALGGTGIHSVNVGIGLHTPTERLHVNGNIRVDGNIIQNSIINATLNTGWTNLGNQFETAGFYKGKDGRVYLQGTVVKNAGSGIVVFSLPVGYRPAKELRFLAYRHSNLSAHIAIDSYGSVMELSSSPVNSQISLDGISFRVD